MTLSAGGGGGGTNGHHMSDATFATLTGSTFGEGNFDGGPGLAIGSTTGQEGAAGGTFGPKIIGFEGIMGNTGSRSSITHSIGSALPTAMGRGGSGPNLSSRDNLDGNAGVGQAADSPNIRQVASAGLVVIF